MVWGYKVVKGGCWSTPCGPEAKQTKGKTLSLFFQLSTDSAHHKNKEKLGKNERLVLRERGGQGTETELLTHRSSTGEAEGN